MTSESDNLKTNEILRLRKLRLQQVREQSKDIAKKIRQRAKVEQLRHVTNVDTNKKKVYQQQQERLVNRLEQLYSKSLANVGVGHKNASEVNQKDIPEKKDLSKLRGKEAAAELRRIKQAKLDEQQKLLDRKLQARDTANELSREKSVAVVNSLLKSSSIKNINKPSEVNENTEETHKDKPDTVLKTDMATQWEFEEIPNEWEPNIPVLSIPKDDSIKNFASDNLDKVDKSKRLNLFALSDEMPSSLRGGVTSIPEDRLPIKPSLTLVSEYLQNRGLRLREPDTTAIPQKKNPDDLQSIKQTLLRTRASRTDGSICPNICHVLDEQVIPVPCWRAEKNCEYCSHKNESLFQHKQFKSCNICFNDSPTLKPGLPDISSRFASPKPCTWTAHNKCHHRHKVSVSGRSNHIDRSSKSMDSALKKTNSVTVYDHSTRDTRDLPRNVEKLVVRDQSIDDDAYSQALKEAATVENSDKPHNKVQQEMRNRIAVTKQNVEKEYRDTLAFLNSLPKEKPTRSVKMAYMDEDRQQEIKDKRQQKLQDEYKKIVADCSKRHCKHTKCKIPTEDRNRSKSKSPIKIDGNIVDRDFQYSWLPVPESDGSLAIHTIPNTSKERPGNTVKFSSVDTYHEYRSRHKHTPPTKDVNNEQRKRFVETVIIQENSNDSMDSSGDTDTSSVENLQVKLDNAASHKTVKDKQLADAERIIIYKVMESKKEKTQKAKKKAMNKPRANSNFNDGTIDMNYHNNPDLHNNNDIDDVNKNAVSFTQVKEGIYRSVSANGDNIQSMYLSDDKQENKSNRSDVKHLSNEEQELEKGTDTLKDGNHYLNRTPDTCGNCKNKSIVTNQRSEKTPLAATSTSSFKTAFNDKVNNPLSDGGYIKFIDEGGQDAGKFYVGASGFLKDDAYEVVIQLRKKEAEKNIVQSQDKDIVLSKITNENKDKDCLGNQPILMQPTDTHINSPKTYNENIVQNSLSKESLISSPKDIHVVNPQQHVDQDKVSIQSHKESNIQQNKTMEPPKSDKNTYTSFRDSFAIPDNVPKLNPISRPAASTYTQTTHSSPISRPVLMHLSSSTSTTYLSPPDIILPRYLRRGSSETYDDTYERVSSNLNSHNSRPKNFKARCGKCNKQHTCHADTPPNSVRSTGRTTDNYETEHKHNKVKPHKCKNRFEPKICSKQKFKRSENKRFNAGGNCSTLSNKTNRITNNPNKVNLNPVIESYVKKLLNLNKEGLKAIEVVNQECSGVTTPGSSVIHVPSNVNKNEPKVCKKISLEEIKNSWKEQIMKNFEIRKTLSKCNVKTTGSQTERNLKPLYKSNRKRPVHKVKSLNISKQLIKRNWQKRRESTIVTTSPLSVDSRKEKNSNGNSSIERSGIKKISIPRRMRYNRDISNNSSNSDTNKCSVKPPQRKNNLKTKTDIKINSCTRNYPSKADLDCGTESYTFLSHRATTTHYSESEASNVILNRQELSTPPISISTQTNQVDSDVEFVKLAENKILNMEKIADLTEKCTKRLSNLAKVLEEVRKNKSLAYSQISTSDTTSDSDQRSDKNVQDNNNRVHSVHAFNPTVEIQTLTEDLSSLPSSPKDIIYVPILSDIPKPDSFKTPSPLSFSTVSDKSNIDNVPQSYMKNRGKPPPALSRMNLKHVPDGFIIPHELSTVVEVDSPMSVKHKSHTTRLDSKHDNSITEITDNHNLNNKDDTDGKHETQNKSTQNTDHNVLYSKISKGKYQTQSTDSSDDSKMKMMDMKQFNEIMLKPFISLKDYAKQYNLNEPDDGSSRNGISKDEHANEELSSLHSEASLPDVMTELLKRNLISEPFKFETTSNVNTSTVSSESTLSLLALSKVRKEKKKSDMVLKNKENVAETSESLSLSSNPDLENAFQTFGMGWASSTLKKTKERLALSSTSNTSSSSIPQFKLKSFNYQDLPELSKDSIISLMNMTSKNDITNTQNGTISETAKNAVQQTSLTNSMTVKEFLANELAKKITFSNKSNKNATGEEFISLCETKIPDEMKRLAQKFEENEKSIDSPPNVTNSRARTSTPVQIYKSMTYHSTSSSNVSNGLFSNAEELSSVKVTSNSNKNHSTSDKDDLTIPNYSLKMRKGLSDCSKSD